MSVWMVFLFILPLYCVVSGPPVTLPPKCIVQTDVFRGTKSECDGGDLRLMSDVANNPVPPGERYGATDMADLILSRGGIFNQNKRNLNNIQICQKHEKEYGRDWTKSSKNRPRRKILDFPFKCNLPNWPGFTAAHDVVSAALNVFLTKEQSETLSLEQSGVFVPLGTGKK